MRGVLCIIGPDGHVVREVSEQIPAPRLLFDLAVLAEAGITGYSAVRLPLSRAICLWAAGYDCPDCAIRCQCGCLIDDVQAGGCPHGSSQLLETAAVSLALRTGFTG